MAIKRERNKRIKLISLFLVGLLFQPLVVICTGMRSLAQTPPAATSNACAEISSPLTPEELADAKTAWQYFLNNYQQATGFTNSTGGYPSGTLWDMGNYLMALNAARWLNLTDQADFDNRLNKFLTNIGNLKLFEDTLPNKVYNAANGQMVDYGNNPIERGIGWSALDIGRILAAFHVLRTCHPQYNDWLKGIVAKWNVAKSLQDGQLFGATVLPDNKTLLVQEGRLGYEEYAARGYELWGFKAPKALALEPFKFVDVNQVKIPVDTRDYKATNANNYVVSESYILDGIEFGLEGVLKEYAARVFEAQKRRYESTGQLTAVTEDNLDQAPYFIYNTVYANGVAWAPITEKNEQIPQFRNISTKAAYGWRYLYPDNPYAQKVFDAVKSLKSPDNGGFYAGLYEESKQPNKSLTGNTNGLILEILYFKARGNRPLIGSNLVTFASPSGDNSAAAPSTPTPESAATPTAPPLAATPTAPPPAATETAKPAETNVVAVAPIPSVGKLSSRLELARPLTAVERRYAEGAWSYFRANYQPKTGLVSDRSDTKAATIWGLGDYLAALQAADNLAIISETEFDQRTRHLLAALGKLPLFAAELPTRGYDIRTLQPVDYNSKPVAEPTGFSALDIGRLLAALYNLKSYHPEYTNAVDQLLLNWSYLRVVRDGMLYSAVSVKDDTGQPSQRFNPETRLGYEEYAARAFQMWGFDVANSAIGGEYETSKVEDFKIPTQRKRPNGNTSVNQYTVSNPFLVYGLELGPEPQMRQFLTAMLRAQAQRYRRTGTFTASATTLIDREPYIVHSTIIGQGEPWAALGYDGKPVADDTRMVSTAAAFAFHALFPDDEYARQLWQATTDLYNPLLGYYEGFYEKTGKTAFGFTGNTNSTILQSLLYQATNRQALIRPIKTMNSPWWEAVERGNSGRGLPMTATAKARLVSDNTGRYWVSTDKTGTATAATSVKLDTK
ncbi:DUF3131 domain-containing protein [Microseira wollei]|nr:DUF3131 domain-containing protein [Microseira wollei]